MLGDVITAVNQRPTHGMKDLFAALADYELGAKIKLTVLRDGDTREVDLVLESLP